MTTTSFETLQFFFPAVIILVASFGTIPSVYWLLHFLKCFRKFKEKKMALLVDWKEF